MRREVPVEQAVGMTLAHDLTKIVPGEFKGRIFAKGHVIQEEDIPVLLDIGKRHIFVLELTDDELHENDAAKRMADALAGANVYQAPVHEGKIVLKASHSGMLWVDAKRVTAMNMIDDISITTRVPYTHVDEGKSVAGIKPIPLLIEKKKVEEVEEIACESVGGNGIIDIMPYKPQKILLITTGSEIASGRVEDKSGPVLREKFYKLGFKIDAQLFFSDEMDEISAAIAKASDDGATMVCVTGGMSVDPDDRSPGAIKKAATHVVTYGVPLLPGSMMMLAYRHETAIFGLPGAVIYDPVTSFDILLPRVLAGIAITKKDIAPLGVGGWLNA
jgi:molybdenum cofactor synthesis domain-containing protein